jgi:ElaB/YqjD/DUF883 family membrane-anchored ribosome-binding protein
MSENNIQIDSIEDVNDELANLRELQEDVLAQMSDLEADSFDEYRTQINELESEFNRAYSALTDELEAFERYASQHALNQLRDVSQELHMIQSDVELQARWKRSNARRRFDRSVEASITASEQFS